MFIHFFLENFPKMGQKCFEMFKTSTKDVTKYKYIIQIWKDNSLCTDAHGIRICAVIDCILMRRKSHKMVFFYNWILPHSHQIKTGTAGSKCSMALHGPDLQICKQI